MAETKRMTGERISNFFPITSLPSFELIFIKRLTPQAAEFTSFDYFHYLGPIQGELHQQTLALLVDDLVDNRHRLA